LGCFAVKKDDFHSKKDDFYPKKDDIPTGKIWGKGKIQGQWGC